MSWQPYPGGPGQPQTGGPARPHHPPQGYSQGPPPPHQPQPGPPHQPQPGPPRQPQQGPPGQPQQPPRPQDDPDRTVRRRAPGAASAANGPLHPNHPHTPTPFRAETLQRLAEEGRAAQAGFPAQAQAGQLPSYAPNPTQRPVLRWVLIGSIVTVFALIAVLWALYFLIGFGVPVTAIALIGALIPLFIVIPTFLWLDSYASEPVRYLAFAFFWGALVSTLVSLIFNTVGGVLVIGATGATDEGTASALTAVLVAPPVEETFKGVLLLLFLVFRRHTFDGITDGMVYAGLVAAGFAFTENIMYLGMSTTEAGPAGFIITVIMRCIASPFAHPMFTCLTGIGVGIAALSSNIGVRIFAPFAGWVCAVLAHAGWNALATMVPNAGYQILAHLVILLPIFLAWLGMIVWARQREGKLVAEHLGPYVEYGWLDRSELQMLSSLSARRAARRWAKQNRGPMGLRSMRAFQDTAVDLSCIRRRMYHGSAPVDAQLKEGRMLEALGRERAVFAGHQW